MKVLIGIAIFALFYTAILWCAPPRARVVGDEKKPKLELLCDCQSGEECDCKDCWCGPELGAAWEQAVKEDSPLLVYVKQRAFAKKGCISCRSDRVMNEGYPCTILGVPDGKGGIREVARRDGTPSQEWIDKAVKGVKKNDKKTCPCGRCQ